MLPVRIEDPIQQGLRHSRLTSANSLRDAVRIEDPIQQGLRHYIFFLKLFNCLSQNRRSNTTRIKTLPAKSLNSCSFVRIEDPIQQGLRPFPNVNP